MTTLTPTRGAGADPAIPGARFDHFWDECFQACYRYPDLAGQLAIMQINQNETKSRVQNHDAYITQLAKQYNVHKALMGLLHE